MKTKYIQRNSKQITIKIDNKILKKSPVGDFDYNMSTAQLGIWLD